MATRKQELMEQIIAEMHRVTGCHPQMLDKFAVKFAPSKYLKRTIADAPIEVKQAFVEAVLPFAGLHLGSIFGEKPRILSRGAHDQIQPLVLPSIDEMHTLRDSYYAALIADVHIEQLQEGLARTKAFTKADCVRFWQEQAKFIDHR